MRCKRFVVLGVLGLAASATVQGAVVTYTLSLHESSTCQPTANNAFAVWVSVSQADNAGLFGFGVDLAGTGDPGGPTTMTLVNRTPSGTFDVDPTDPNYDSGQVYPTKYYGFTAGRSQNSITGIVSGIQDLSKGSDMIPLFGYGQTSRSASSLRPPDDTSTGVPVRYQTNPVAQSGSDVIWPPCAPPFGVAAGSARLLTGAWTGNPPSIQTTSVNTKASVWKLDHPNNTENELATMQFAIIGEPPNNDTVSLNGPTKGSNQAVGGAISVS